MSITDFEHKAPGLTNSSELGGHGYIKDGVLFVDLDLDLDRRKRLDVVAEKYR